MNVKDMVIVIQGAPVLTGLYREFEWKHREWEAECNGVRARFKKKTSRSNKNGQIYEYTNWYEETGSGLKSVGKTEPDYSKFYPPEPKLPYSFEYNEYEGHIIISQKDYEANQKHFKDCLVFGLEEGLNRSHALYKNPEKALKDSVRKPGVSSGRSAVSMETEKGTIDMCLGDGDCDNCEHSDECPVG
ncbi:MAG: hypothetical protein OIN66_09350 [Candidatus Methanoperedens sp.]|nr:hypothetical protein [Candidatus Methanoperedens sp.]